MRTVKFNLKKPSSLIIKDPLYNKDKLIALASSDIFVHPSRTEGMPNGVLEAMSLALPCLISHETNMGPIIKESKCGWVVDNQVKSYVKKFEEIESITKQKLLAIGKNGQIYSKEHLTWKNVSKSKYF
jgi:glycosyltransferase involved in cell wall biosynthesis